MTNKMPVVGRRYKIRNQLGSGNGEIVMVVSVDKDFSCQLFNCCPITGEKIDKSNQTTNPVDFKKEEVNKVDLALEELKNILMKATLSNAYYHEQYKEMKELAQKLVDVLEAEKSAMNLVKDTLKKGIKQMKDFNAKMDEKYPMSKLDTKIDTKEECVEPVSIWKDVNELPRCLDGAAVFYKRDGQTFIGEAHTFNGIAIYPDSNSDFLNNEDIDKVCLVSDFINSFEQMQKDIEDLKRK
jgi:uncharacterized protein (DUF342 family)